MSATHSHNPGHAKAPLVRNLPWGTFDRADCMDCGEVIVRPQATPDAAWLTWDEYENGAVSRQICTADEEGSG